MRYLRLSAAFLAAACAVYAAAGEFTERRAALAKSLNDGAIVLFGRTAAETDDWRTGFRQEPGFYYLTGWEEPGAVLILAPPAEILLLPRRDPVRERYTGHRAAPDDPGVAALAGFPTVLPVEHLEGEVRKALERYPKLYTLGDPAIERLKKIAPLREVLSAAPAMAKLRMVKSPEEVALLRKAAGASMLAHRAAWKRAA